jgi:3-oxoacyl-[acyl-carrier-protein] synthase II
MIFPLGLACFDGMSALSKDFNHHPEEGSRPFDKKHSGFVLSEGAGALILESEAHALNRKAPIKAVLEGYGASGDAHHISNPHPEGRGAQQAMKHALHQAGISPQDIGYINAHGTSTPVGDPIELNAISKVFHERQDKLYVSSTKSMTGHALGASGSFEAIFTIEALRKNILPPTINLEEPIAHDDMINLVPNNAEYLQTPLSYVLSNSFGFGGTNASLIFGRYEKE